MIRVGQTRNLLRASSSLLEIWPRSAHHHPGQRHLSGRTNRPDKSPHSITCLMFRNSLQMRAASTREGWTSGPSPPPLAPAKAFSRSGCGRIFPLFSGVMRVGLLTDPRPKGRTRVLSGPTFSRPVNRTNFGSEPQHPEKPTKPCPTAMMRFALAVNRHPNVPPDRRPKVTPLARG